MDVLKLLKFRPDNVNNKLSTCIVLVSAYKESSEKIFRN